MVDVEGVRFMPDEVMQLGTKYGLIIDDSNWINDENKFQKFVVELKKSIKTMIAKEMRLKEGYENLKRATKDKKHTEKLKSDLREISDRIDEMHTDVQTLDIYATGTICKGENLIKICELVPRNCQTFSKSGSFTHFFVTFEF